MRATGMMLILAIVPILPTAAAGQTRGDATARTGGDTDARTADPFLWLEDVDGQRAMAWVQAQNARTLTELSASPFFQPITSRVISILDSEDRIAMPSIIGEYIYNFWQDAAHPRGLWRRTSWSSYATADPQWETVIDIDALVREENVPWSLAGFTCLEPEYRNCLVSLSRGGSDANEVREFDAAAGRFVDGGFLLPESKGSVDWFDGNTLLVARDFGPGTMTTSGYPRTVKVWKRGTPLTDATQLIEIPATDMGVFSERITTSTATHFLISHAVNFYESITWLYTDGRIVRLEIPADASSHFVGDQLVVYIRSPWETGGRTWAAGSLIATGLRSFLAGDRAFTLILAPSATQTITDVRATREHLLVGLLDNVRGALRRYTPAGGAWSYQDVPAPDFGTVSVASTSPATDRFFFTYSGFTQPTTLYVAGDGSTGHEPAGTVPVRALASLPAMFKADGLQVEQHHAVSKDGTRIPYFVVAREGLAMDGNNPVLLTAYGGFEVPRTAGYSPVTGAAWLERGGTYVLANIRGGGEFGPSWHRAGLKENRQRVFDDFIAVAEDLIARRITSPARLGIMGGSNGGLLVGVAVTQRPDLFGAAVIQVPLLDMQRYNKLLAGASWMAEYGNPDIPEEWAYIQRYSPYHNVRAETRYPRVLLTTTTRDDRVHPGHARKMAARLEDMGHPFLFFENVEGGHGAGVTSEQKARTYAVEFTYLWEQLTK